MAGDSGAAGLGAGAAAARVEEVVRAAAVRAVARVAEVTRAAAARAAAARVEVGLEAVD